MKLSIFLIFLINLATCWKKNEIDTYYGKIVGFDVTVLDEKVTQFLGVPYAQSPTIFYRFKQPYELEQNRFKKQPYFAVHKALGCPQHTRIMGFEGYDSLNPKETSENCLRLNMWVPKNGEKMPVIVFFHGGSWTVRTGSADKFNGSVLALKTKSIVVVPNFRLGFFGFAYLSGEDGIEGNMGLLDQQMVLTWINRVIESFGGTYTNRSIRILSDFIFDCELSRFAITYANFSKHNTYFYEYNRRSPINPWPEWTGAMHGDDLIDIFGIPFRHPEKYNTSILEREKKYSENVMWAIGNFTTYGNTTSVWNKLNATESKALVFNGELGQPGKTPPYTNVTPPTCTEFYKILVQSILRTALSNMLKMAQNKSPK
ncbi:Carboxylesterase, type B domain-containing protein [Strongyloides ratti]|uniref:Carboxylesterase, type B domain-containing protein n=1 Tax=Strongyloides ratti TaxID=34506 RepID=A0A090LUJ3_STRRB|nr:Carboxylesterase, type B domain-containing protein [Strongyloides ratti]CEF71289.1 Carboxylesterase, type B domain-containing protein [Strongyloides ratti]